MEDFNSNIILDNDFVSNLPYEINQDSSSDLGNQAQGPLGSNIEGTSRGRLIYDLKCRVKSYG